MFFRGFYISLALAFVLFSYVGFGGSCETPTVTTLPQVEVATPTSDDPCAPGRMQAKKPDREQTEPVVLPAAELRYGILLAECQKMSDAAEAFERAVKDARLVDDEPVESEALRRHGAMLAANGNVEQGKHLIWAALDVDEAYALNASALLDIQELEKLYLKPKLQKEDIPKVQDLTARKIRVETELSKFAYEQLLRQQEMNRALRGSGQ